MKRPLLILSLGIFFMVMSGHVVFAETPLLSLSLEMLKNNIPLPYYSTDENIYFKASAVNNSGKQLIVSEGFYAVLSHHHIRLIGPSGEIIRPRMIPGNQKLKMNMVTPFGYIERNGKPIKVAPCTKIPKNAKMTGHRQDLLYFFDLFLPGVYSAQLQFSTMVFKPPLCNVDDYEWQGTIKSDTLYFFYEGSSQIDIDPPVWEENWLTVPTNDIVTVKIFYDLRILPGSINPGSIRINAAPIKPFFSHIPQKTKKWLELYLVPKECFKIYRTGYPITITGTLNDGTRFGSARMIGVIPAFGHSYKVN